MIDRASKARKRKFHGNQYTRQSNESVGHSASAKKMSSSSSDDVPWNSTIAYRFLELSILFTPLSDLLVCQ